MRYLILICFWIAIKKIIEIFLHKWFRDASLTEENNSPRTIKTTVLFIIDMTFELFLDDFWTHIVTARFWSEVSSSRNVSISFKWEIGEPIVSNCSYVILLGYYFWCFKVVRLKYYLSCTLSFRLWWKICSLWPNIKNLPVRPLLSSCQLAKWTAV